MCSLRTQIQHPIFRFLDALERHGWWVFWAEVFAEEGKAVVEGHDVGFVVAELHVEAPEYSLAETGGVFEFFFGFADHNNVVGVANNGESCGVEGIVNVYKNQVHQHRGERAAEGKPGECFSAHFPVAYCSAK